MKRWLNFGLCLLFALFPLGAFGTNYTVKTPSGGNFTTIQACANAMAAGDTCTVYAGTYAETVTISAGTVGNYKTITVNGSDKVQLTGKFNVNSHVRIIGNCPALQGTVTTLICGFFITDPSSPLSTDCIDVSGGSTDFYIVGNTMYACNGLHINRGSSPHTSHGFIQQNTISYPGTTTATCPPNAGACNVSVALPMSCDYCLVEQNDISHTADFDNEYDGIYNVFRKNSFHDNSQAECLSGTHGDQCHIDFVESEPGASSYPTEYTLVESNTEVNNIGSNSHGYLFQGDTCSGNCFDVILRFNQTAHVGGGGLLDDLGGFYNVHLYNNTWIDMTQNGLTGGITNHWKSASTGGSSINELFYYPSAVSNFNAIACEDTSCTGFNHGHNLAFCGPFGSSSTCPSGSSGILGYQYGTGAWLSDAGNLLTDPKVVSYSSSGLGNFSLQAGSPARNAGINLTTVNGGITSSTSLVVTDAHYFQDGHTIPGVQADCIAVTTISNHVCITAVNYSTNTLTLASAISAANGAPVWIYSISDGTMVLTDTTAPDMGALPFSPSVTCGPPTYPCSATNSTVAQTPNTPPFTSPTSSGTSCTPGSANYSGNGCAGSVGYDTSLNAYGLNPYLRVSDNAAISGRSCGSTFSGGDNDEAWSCTGRADTSPACSAASLYLTTCASPSGGVYAAGVKIQSNVPTLVAPLPASSSSGHPSPGGALSFANQDPLTAYVMSAESDPKLYKVVYAWDGTVGHPLTLTQTQLVDVGATCPLPNGTSFNTQSTGGISHDINDNIFASDLSNVIGVALGVDTATVANGSPNFTLTGSFTMATDGSLVHAVINLGGVAYTIATVTSGTTGTLTANYAGTSGSGVSVSIPSGQGTALYEVFVQLAPAGCIVMNTYTGTFAANGAFASLDGQAWDSSCSGVRIHDGFMMRDGSYIQISGANTGTNCGTVSIFYQIGTNHLVPCTAVRNPGGVTSICQGHQAFGYHNDITGTGPYLVNFAPANASSASPFTGFSPLPPSGSFCDTHFTWRNATSGDTQPVFFQTAGVNYSTSGTTSTWTIPISNEIGAAPLPSGSFIRFGHTYALGASACYPGAVGPFDSNTNFEAQNAIGVTSQDGRLMSFASSMLGQLGSDTNGQTYRSDLIVMGLDMKASATFTVPTVSTTTATSITATSAQAGGTVTANGGTAVTDEGTCYAVSANPSTPCTHDGTATPFTSSLTGLTSNTLYHYRAFATNGVGTAYGADQTFTTGSTAPTVTTTTASSITSSSAQAGGTVISNGGAVVSSEGTCYGTAANPTTPCTSDGTATPYVSFLTGLTASTLYHYRAFAANLAGIGYGSDQTFTTLMPPPPTYVLTVTVTGSGSVSSSPSGISGCTSTGGTCSASFSSGTVVTLSASPAAGHQFSSWSGVCSGIVPTCSVTMTAAQAAGASFTLIPPDPSGPSNGHAIGVMLN